MCRPAFPALFIACASLAMPAAAQSSWEFSYTGFLNEDSGRFDPALRLDGAFQGSDTNGNGRLERDELTAFLWNGYSYLEDPYGGCYGARCELRSFSYNLGKGQLSFEAHWRYSDEAAISETTTITGESYTFQGQTGYQPPFSYSGTVYRWTDQTRFAISPPPVDEAPASALLTAGLLLVGATLVPREIRRRRIHLSPVRSPTMRRWCGRS
jgi:hypothetical protein